MSYWPDISIKTGQKHFSSNNNNNVFSKKEVNLNDSFCLKFEPKFWFSDTFYKICLKSNFTKMRISDKLVFQTSRFETFTVVSILYTIFDTRFLYSKVCHRLRHFYNILWLIWKLTITLSANSRNDKSFTLWVRNELVLYWLLII